jgi:hypothetical protein
MMKALLIRAVCGAAVLVATGLPAAATAAQPTPSACCADVSTVLTKTMVHVHVAQLDVHVDSATAARVQATIGNEQSASNALADSIAAAYMAASSAGTTMEFLHSVSLSQFLGGQKDALKHLVQAGMLSQSAADEIQKDTETQFAFLQSGGINNGDKLINDVRGDSLTTRFVAAGGSEKANFTRVGPERRIGLLGDYFGPHSDFRSGLIQSAMESATAARGN